MRKKRRKNYPWDVHSSQKRTEYPNKLLQVYTIQSVCLENYIDNVIIVFTYFSYTIQEYNRNYLLWNF